MKNRIEKLKYNYSEAEPQDFRDILDECMIILEELEEEVKDLEIEIRKINSLYQRVSNDRQVYISLWEQVPVKQRLQIHAALENKENDTSE